MTVRARGVLLLLASLQGCRVVGSQATGPAATPLLGTWEQEHAPAAGSQAFAFKPDGSALWIISTPARRDTFAIRYRLELTKPTARLDLFDFMTGSLGRLHQSGSVGNWINAHHEETPFGVAHGRCNAEGPPSRRRGVGCSQRSLGGCRGRGTHGALRAADSAHGRRACGARRSRRLPVGPAHPCSTVGSLPRRESQCVMA
jgi:hypothetical protein